MESQEAELREAMVALLPRLRRFAHALTGAQADADDLVQAGLERALRSLAQFEPGTRLDSWLFRVLRNAWIDEVRARGRQAKIFAPAEAGESIGDDAPAALEAKREMREVAMMLQDLAEEQRLAISLVCVEGLSYREAAAVLDVPIGTVTSRLARAREALLAKSGSNL